MTTRKPAARKPVKKAVKKAVKKVKAAPKKVAAKKPAAKKAVKRTVKKAAPKKKAAAKKTVKKAVKKAAPRKKAKQGPAVHTVPHDKGWANKRAGASKVSRVFSTKTAAQKAGRETAMREKVEHIIHNASGKMGERNSYGNDPRGRG
ncbi:MAG: DUF2188 domain-containing protein [Acidimicrobiia bacterium]